IVNRNINFTNICFVGCKFCAFSRGPREADTYFLTLDQMAKKAVEAWELGSTEVCIQGGLPHGLPAFHYAEILDDQVRHILSANKLSTAQWVEVIRTAHRCGIRTTSTLMYGHTETPA